MNTETLQDQQLHPNKMQRVSQACLDNCMRCHTETEAAYQILYLTSS